MSAIKWQEPPAPKRDRGKWDRIAKELRANPGRWALVAEGKSQGSGYVLSRESDIERRLVTNPAGGFDVYMRAVTR